MLFHVRIHYFHFSNILILFDNCFPMAYCKRSRLSIRKNKRKRKRKRKHDHDKLSLRNYLLALLLILIRASDLYLLAGRVQGYPPICLKHVLKWESEAAPLLMQLSSLVDHLMLRLLFI